MVINVSCYNIHFNRRGENHIVFIRYDEYLKIYFNYNKPIIIYYNDIFKNEDLYNYYLLSLLLTKDIYNIFYDNKNITIINKNRWCIIAKKDWKRMHFTDYYEIMYGFKKNPFTQQKPKRISSEKKIRKFYKWLNIFVNNYSYYNRHYFIDEPDGLDVIEDYLYKEYIEELERLEEYIYKIENEIKRMTLIYSKFKIPIDIINKIIKMI